MKEMETTIRNEIVKIMTITGRVRTASRDETRSKTKRDELPVTQLLVPEPKTRRARTKSKGNYCRAQAMVDKKRRDPLCRSCNKLGGAVELRLRTRNGELFQRFYYYY